MVPEAGLEPARLAAQVFETCASADSATPAKVKLGLYSGNRVHTGQPVRATSSPVTSKPARTRYPNIEPKGDGWRATVRIAGNLHKGEKRRA